MGYPARAIRLDAASTASSIVAWIFLQVAQAALAMRDVLLNHCA